ncbi:MAG: AtzG-like protein [Burkholderiales bacterium]
MDGLARPDVTAQDVKAYVEASCVVLGLALAPAAVERVAETFAMNARLASLVTSFEIPEAEDPLALTRIP